jgi:general secretion pathway protein L
MRVRTWIDGWIDGLAALLLAAGGLVSGGKRLTLRLVEGRWVVAAGGRDGGRPIASVTRSASGEIELQPVGAEKALTGGRFEVAAPPGAVVVHRLDPLPAESRPFVDGIVRHQLDRFVPWRAADVVYTTDVAPAGDGRIAVTVAATSRRALAAPLAVAARCRAKSIVVVGAGEETRPIPVPLGESDAKTWRHARTAAAGILAALVLLAAADAIWSTVRWYDLTGRIAEIDAATADRRALLRSAADAAGRPSGPPTTLDQLKRQSPIAVVVMESLSRVLPDDAYLTDFRLEDGRVRLIGVSRSVADLVPLLEASDAFDGASFFAPTIRIAGGDRFHIEAAVVPQLEPAP